MLSRERSPRWRVVHEVSWVRERKPQVLHRCAVGVRRISPLTATNTHTHTRLSGLSEPLAQALSFVNGNGDVEGFRESALRRSEVPLCVCMCGDNYPCCCELGFANEPVFERRAESRRPRTWWQHRAPYAPIHLKPHGRKECHVGAGGSRFAHPCYAARKRTLVAHGGVILRIQRRCYVPHL